jgi:chromosome segregation ATPase
MSEDPTQNVPHGLTFEERVFARFDALDARMGRIESRLDGVESRLDRVESRLDRVESRLDSLEARQIALEEKVERRLQETRPIWEQFLRGSTLWSWKCG